MVAMDCHKCKGGKKVHLSLKDDHNCVCDKVKKIVQAQRQVEFDCDSSCHQFIQQLKGDQHRVQHTTIPFMLYCESTCKPFIGSGYVQKKTRCSSDHYYQYIETPFFKAKDVDKKCCAKLELLLPDTDFCCEHHCCDPCTCSYKDNPIKRFLATGVCLTVDLNKFIGINCLAPNTPIDMGAY